MGPHFHFAGGLAGTDRRAGPQMRFPGASGGQDLLSPTRIVFLKEAAPLHRVSDLDRARALLHPLRLAVLLHAREPASAPEIAARLGLSRQRVHYHVRALADAGFLRRAGRRTKRNMVEQRYVAVARSFVLSPELLGELAPDATGSAPDLEARRVREVEPRSARGRVPVERLHEPRAAGDEQRR